MPRRPLLGLMGEQGAGKSALIEQLHVCAGTQCNKAADIEFSDAIIEAARYALHTGIRTLDEFRVELRRGAQRVLRLDDGLMKPLDWLETLGEDLADIETAERRDLIRRAEEGLAQWLPTVLPDLYLERGNKALHRPVQSWLGVIIRELAGQHIWAQETAKRVFAAWPSRLVTAGGVRFPEDAAAIRADGGLILEIIGRTHNADTDPANARRKHITPDIVFYNDVWDPSLELLKEAAAELWADMSMPRSPGLKPEYRVRREAA